MDLYLIEKGKFVVLRKGDQEISFSSFEQYQTYSGIDLTGKNYVCYQPNDNFEIDDSQQDKTISSEFKAQILSELDKISIYQSQKADIYFGKSDSEKKEIKKKTLNQDMQNYIMQLCDVPTQTSLQAIYTRSDTSAENKAKIETIWNWIQSILIYYYQKKSAIDTDFNTEWDYSATFDATRPVVKLSDFL